MTHLNPEILSRNTRVGIPDEAPVRRNTPLIPSLPFEPTEKPDPSVPVKPLPEKVPVPAGR